MQVLLSYRNRHLICCHWRNVKENNKKNEIEYRFKNNNYINSRNQTRPESSMNPFSPKTNSFLDRSKNVIIKCSIQEGIRLWREGIHTGFLPGLIPGINIIIIFESRFNLIFLVVLFHISPMAANQVPVAIRVYLSDQFTLFLLFFNFIRLFFSLNFIFMYYFFLQSNFQPSKV